MYNFNSLLKNPLFKGIAESEVSQVLDCLKAETKTYAKGQHIFHIGDVIYEIGIVLSGYVHIVKYDIWGNAHIIQDINEGEFFAETYACQRAESLVDVIAAQESEILFINVQKSILKQQQHCPFHQIIIQNLLQVMAEKNLNLIKKIELITPKNIRDRILGYLSTQIQKNGKYDFDILFNRQQLADYLSVDRSALSYTLSKMQKEGLIVYKKNHFSVKK